jgi:MFS family permease
MGEPNKCWGVQLNEGISPRNLKVFYFSAFAAIMLFVGANVLQPYILTTFLKLPVPEHGSATGNIMLVAEIVMFICVGVWGVVSDKTGRRAVYVLGFLIIGVGFGLTPLSRTLVMLIGFRGFTTIGIAASGGMLATILADYVHNKDRGKASAISGVMNGFGAIAGALALGKLPSLYGKMGQDGVTAGWSAYATVVVLCVITAVVLSWGLKGGVYHKATKRTGFLQLAKEGIQAAKADPGVTLAYAAAFVSRADMTVAGLFLPLWLSRHFQSELPVGATVEQIDLASQQGIAAGGALIGIVGSAGLISAPFIGILCDRINRVTALAIGLSLNVIGYGLIFFVEDPTGGFIKIAAVGIGFGQTGGIISTQVLIQQHAAPAVRGSIIGFYSMCGSLGIMVLCWFGGQLFDAVSPMATFEMVAVANLVVVVMALLLKSKIKVPDFADDDLPVVAH